MADPIRDVGALAFAVLMAFMVFCAGVAVLPPARDVRVFIGAVVLFAAWLLVIRVVSLSGSWLVTSTMVALDFVYAFIFLRLASPGQSDPPNAVYDRNWASYVFAVLTAIIMLELGNVIYRFPGPHQIIAFVCFVFVASIVAGGFARGFGLQAAAIFVFSIALIGVAAIASYVRTVNFLTLMIIVIITHAALRGAWRNLRAWFYAASTRPDDPSRDDEQRSTLAEGLNFKSLDVRHPR